MNHKFIKLTAAAMLFVIIAQAQTKISYEDAVRKFYSTYDLTNYDFSQVRWEKRKNNWYVKALISVEGETVTGKPELYYDGEKGVYLDLHFPERKSSDSIDAGRYIDEYAAYYFNLYPYYGYYKWYDDLISDFSKIKNPNDDQLYLLGRAYSSRAISPVSNLDGDRPEKDMYQLDFDVNSFKKEDWKKFARDQDSSIALFKRVYLRNPKFQTRVGDMTLKYSNEVMAKFHIQLVFSYDEALKSTIPSGLYEDSILRVCRDYLISCPKDAILVSFTDNDFYPVLYLQYKEELRKDVHLVNYNLLAMGNYIYRATQPQFDAKGISLALDTGIYKGGRNELIYVNDSAYSISVGQLNQLLLKSVHEGVIRPTLAANSIMVTLKYEEPTGEMMAIGAKANFPLDNVRHLFKNHWIILNILDNLKGRKIVFTYGFYDQLSPLNAHLKEIGKVYLYEN